MRQKMAKLLPIISNPVASELFLSVFSPFAFSAPSAVKSFRCNRKRYNWIFQLDLDDGIIRAIIDRSGVKARYNYGFGEKLELAQTEGSRT